VASRRRMIAPALLLTTILLGVPPTWVPGQAAYSTTASRSSSGPASPVATSWLTLPSPSRCAGRAPAEVEAQADSFAGQHRRRHVRALRAQSPDRVPPLAAGRARSARTTLALRQSGRISHR